MFLKILFGKIIIISLPKASFGFYILSRKHFTTVNSKCFSFKRKVFDNIKKVLFSWFRLLNSILKINIFTH